MSLELPNPGEVFIPDVPASLAKVSPEFVSYMERFKVAVEMAIRDQFTNSLFIATAINSGISGTFTISSGGSIIVTSGIVINVTS